MVTKNIQKDSILAWSQYFEVEKEEKKEKKRSKNKTLALLHITTMTKKEIIQIYIPIC